MPTVIPVKFAYVNRDLWFDPAGTGAAEGDHVICATERGQEIGLATEDPREVSDAELASKVGNAQLKAIVRIAGEDDLTRAEELAERGDAAMPTFRRMVEDSGLDMKPVGVEYLFDGEKAVCYFAAEERVDFRQLVRDLSRELHVRIDMRQIGVREEAAIVGGWGHCGQELCCRRFNTGFDPVSIRMAKEQDLPLNSTKISGACGRLMCCLRYEFEAYRDFKQRAPKKNAVIDTPLGKGKIVEYDTPKEQIALRLESGKVVRVPLASMTASEAAHKKSEELGCPCRPDTVTRDVLERLESPDVQMALAELDRKNGVLPDAVVDVSDIFVETPRRKRRGSGSGEAAAGQRGERPQRREASSAEKTEGASQQSSRRRKRRGESVPEAGTSEGQTQSQAQGQGTRRRRHHQAEGDVLAPQAQDEQKGSEQGSRRARRPGDKGGGMRPSRDKQRQQREREQSRSNNEQQAKGPERGSDRSGGASDASKPRRRRHRGNGGAGGSKPEGGAPSAE